MIRFLRVAYSIPHFPFLCNSISKLSPPLIPTFWGEKRRGTLERVPRTPQNFHKYALTRVLPVIFKWLRPEGMSVPRGFCSRGAGGASPDRASAARVQPRGCKGRSPLHKITLVSPFPPGRGSGGRGQKGKQTARSAGGKEGKPPPDTGTPPSFVSRETSPFPAPFHVKHLPHRFT